MLVGSNLERKEETKVKYRLRKGDGQKSVTK